MFEKGYQTYIQKILSTSPNLFIKEIIDNTFACRPLASGTFAFSNERN